MSKTVFIVDDHKETCEAIRLVLGFEGYRCLDFSNGGSALLATIDSRTTGGPDLSDFKLAIAFYPGCRKAEKDPGWKNRTPLEILMGANDNWTLPASCQSIVDRLQMYPDSFHDFDAPNVPLQELHGLTYSPTHRAMIGTNEKARAAAIERVMELLRSRL
jgi:dienelactone hydrolase